MTSSAVWVRGLVEGDRAMRVALDTEVEVNGEAVLLSSVPEGSVAYLSIVSMEAQERLVAVRRLPSSEGPTDSDERELTLVFRGPGLPSTEELANDLSRAAGLLSLTLGSEVEIRGGGEVLTLLREDDLLAGDRIAPEGEGTDPPVDVGAWVEEKLGALRIAEELGGKGGGFSVFFARMYLERWLADPGGVSEDLRTLCGHVIDEHILRESRKKPRPNPELETYKEVVALLARMPSGVTIGSQSVNAAQSYLRGWVSNPKSLTYDTLAMCRNVVEDYLSQEGL